MTTVQLADLREHLDEVVEAVRNGETVALADGERRVAMVVPEQAPSEMTNDEMIDRLVRAGVATRHGTGRIPKEFFDLPLPKAEASVLEALLEERYSDDE